MLKCFVLMILPCMQVVQAQVIFNKPIIKDKCLTPNGDVGQCVPLQTCDYLVQLLHTDEQGRRDVRTHFCHTNDDNTRVCCKIEHTLILSTTEHSRNTSIKSSSAPTSSSPTITTIIDISSNTTVGTVTSNPLPAATITSAPPRATSVTSAPPPSPTMATDSVHSFTNGTRNTGPKPVFPFNEIFSTDAPNLIDDQLLFPTTSESVQLTTDTAIDSTNGPEWFTTAALDSSPEASNTSSIIRILATTSSYPNHTQNISLFHQASPSTLSTDTELGVSATFSTSATLQTAPEDVTPTHQDSITGAEAEDNGEWTLISNIDVRNDAVMEPTLEMELVTLPWIVGLQFGESNDRDSRCTGTLISDRHILTLARCLSEQQDKPNISSITFNSSEFSLVINCSSSECSSIKEISKHLLDNMNGFTDGIALITLTDPVVLSDEVRPVNLPDLPMGDQTDLSIYKNIVTARPKGMRPRSYFFRTPIPLYACTEWKRSIRKGIHLCTIPTFQSTVATPCLPGVGKGSPLLGWNDEQQTFLLLGLLQREKDECAGTRQTVYLDIRPHLNWIVKVMQR